MTQQSVEHEVTGARTRVRAPLAVSVSRDSWQLHDAKYWGDPHVQRVREAVVHRDDYRCQFCGFQSAPAEASELKDGPNRHERSVGYMEMHPANGDHSRMTAAAHVTCCPFCHGYAHCGVASPGTNGHLISFPNMDPADFNLFMNALAIASRPDSGMHRQADFIYRQLSAFKAPVTNALGQEADDPTIFAAGVLSCSERFPDAAMKLDLPARGIRFLPRFDAYKIAIDWFYRHAALPPNDWKDLLKTWHHEHPQAAMESSNG